MTTLDRLRHWTEAGIITELQHDRLAAIVRKQRFSVFLELNAALYIGVVSLVAGLGWTFQTYFANLGDAVILGTFSLLCAGCLTYCFLRAAPYSDREVEAPSLAFDYVLYFGCLTLSATLAYIEFRFHPFRGAWEYYLLFTAATFGLLAYRFDNRLVLSLALASLAGWFGLRMSAFGFRSADALRTSAVAYGALVAVIGTAVSSRRIKPHFLEAYLHVAANVVFGAVVSGVGARSGGPLYLLALVVLAGAAVVLGVCFNRFAFVAYGSLYGYIGISVRVLQHISNDTAMLTYFVVTGTVMIVSLATLARSFGRDQ